MANQVLCSVCLEVLHKPRMLECWHAVCATCIPTLVLLERTRRTYSHLCFDHNADHHHHDLACEVDAVTCLACGTPSSIKGCGVDALPGNDDLDEELAAKLGQVRSGEPLACDRCAAAGNAPAEAQCLVCAQIGLLSFCGECWTSHHADGSPLASHTRIELVSLAQAESASDSADGGSEDEAHVESPAPPPADGDETPPPASPRLSSESDEGTRFALASAIAQRSRACEIHDLPQTLYCSACEATACHNCAMHGAHSSHHCLPLGETASLLADKLTSATHELQTWIASSRELLYKLDAAKTTLEGRADSHAAAWCALEDKLVDALRVRLASLRQHSLGNETAHEAAQLAAERAYFDARIKLATDAAAAANRLVEGGGDPAILAAAAPMVAELAAVVTGDGVPAAPHVSPDTLFTLLPATVASFEEAISLLGGDDFYCPLSSASPATPPPKALPKPPSKKTMPFGYFADNNLDTVPLEVFDNTHWKRLILAKNFLTSVPEELAGLTALAELDLTHNSITQLPHALTALTNLAKLKVGGNELDEWPTDLTHLPALTELDIGFNSLTTAPPQLASYTALVKLILRRNSLHLLPDGIHTSWGSLVVLDLSKNKLETLGHALDALPKLTELNLAGNKLVNLSSHPLELPNLSRLDVSHNTLDALPAWLWTLPALQWLDASHNSIAQWPEPKLGVAAASATATLSYLNCRHNALTSLPSLVPLATHLDSIIVSHNALTMLPETLGQLTCLETLDVGSNDLVALPSSVGGLCYLAELNVFGNRIARLPDEISMLASGLVVLSVGNNQLTELPDLSQFSELEELVATGNAISAFPLFLLELPRISAVYLGRNAMTSDGISLEDMEAALSGRVTRADISYNQLSEVPPALASALWCCTEGNPGSVSEAFADWTAVGSEYDSPYDALMAGKAYVTGSERARFELGVAEMIGKRPTMEDALTWHWALPHPRVDALQVDYFGLFDGHAGTAASAFCAERLHTNLELPELSSDDSEASHAALCSALVAAIEKTEEELCAFLTSDATPKSDSRGGTTGLFAFFVGGQLTVANVGDSRAVLVPATSFDEMAAGAAESSKPLSRSIASMRRSDSSSALNRVRRRVRRLSMDHKPTTAEEEERIRRARAYVAFNGRVNGNLAVSRAFGDFHLKPYVIAAPYCAAPVAFSSGDVLIMACDGVWDEIDDATAAHVVTQVFRETGSLSRAAAVLRDMAYNSGSTDNISVIVIRCP
ncbi:uncharacterized protein AMSG_11709 [Thecamonas trahens ATCC 50062]|uniref:PPM-type phosphatase domain-containing protein n=1 Tax=Thecamonas trahens ATCC 50062 TaxID=461836 RepID=A0A0L0DVV8_THETB|nr:hypothetical protein AMSG_11709 [Thecamonas trahens ATCC 50062]KNC56454.1 hypothetical protein AMSG_11709 [Thecamonas trahens ATCC 50062]|eukprot:XP_013761002.1 hypothetical protein AMSG_11709 [Thecamonas trahens ATCC 50062]